MGEITVILLLALIFLGPSKLPDLAAGLGKLIKEIRKATSDVKNEIALDDTFRKPFEELRDAVTLHPDELKRRDQLKQSLEEARKRAEAEQAAAAAAAAAAGTAPLAGEGATTEAAATLPVPPPAPIVPEAPPPGTVARREVPPAPPPPPTHLGPPRVTPPISSLASERANVTQVLSEADLLSSAPPPPPAAPPAPPAHLPPPLPGTGSGPSSIKKA